MQHKAKIIIRGKVVRGDGYGKVLGFPTANLDRKQFVRLNRKPKQGIWAGHAKLIKTYVAAIVIGPLDNKGLPKVEAHLIGFKGNLYGKKLEIVLAQYLRPFSKYKSEAALKVQIRKDVEKVKQLKI